MDDFHSEEAASGDSCFYYEIPGGLLDKDVIEITGYFYGERIEVEVLADKYSRDSGPQALPLKLTLTNKGQWTATTYTQSTPRKEQSGTTKPIQNFEIRIVALDAAFEIYLNGTKLCTQKHLVPLSQASHISIDGEAEFTGVEFKDLDFENEVSQSLSGTERLPEVTPGFTRLSENRRSSNRKPKSPVLVPTHGSFRAKPTLATTREEPPMNTNIESGQTTMVKSVPLADNSRASADLSSKHSYRGSNHSLSGRHKSSQPSGAGESKKMSFRDKLFGKKGSKTSIPEVVQEENQYRNAGSAEDVWVEEGGRELSADGAGVYAVSAAASVPNLSTQEKEKKRFSLHRGSKKARSSSSPPVEDKDKKKHHFGGIHLGKSGKKEKEPKPEKDGKKKPFGRRHSKPDSIRENYPPTAVVAPAAVVVTERETANEYSAPQPTNESERATLAALATKKSLTSPPSQHTASHGSIRGTLTKGSYDVENAQRSYDVHSGTYQKMSLDGGVALGAAGGIRSRSPSLNSVGSGASLNAGVEPGQKTKLKGDSALIASQLLSNSAHANGSLENLTYSDPNLDIPLTLAAAGAGAGMVAMAATPKEEHKKKEKEAKLKGHSAEIADNLLGENRGMSGPYLTYIEDETTVPLRMTQEDLLSTGKGVMPLVGPRGSYNLENAQYSSSGTYQQKPEDEWAAEGPIVQSTAVKDVQHSKPPGGAQVDTSGAVLVAAAPVVSQKEKKNLLKGEAAEIASNLVDAEGDRVGVQLANEGAPFCGENGINVPLKVDASNRDAQPVPYGISKTGRYSSASMNSLNAPDGNFAISATQENDVHAAAPLSGSGELYSRNSATLPASGDTTGTVPVAGAVVMRDKDKKDKKGHDGEGKPRKRDRISGFFKGLFKRKKKGGASQSEEEYGVSEGVGTEHEMTEYRTSSQMSSDLDYGGKVPITAKPGETCLYASQLRGNREALRRNPRLDLMCAGGNFLIPLRLTAADIPVDISKAGANYVYAALPLQRGRSDSLSSWTSVSSGGTRRHRHRGDLATKDRDLSLSSYSSVSPGGSRRIYHRSAKHRPESASSWSSISPNGTRRHRRRSDSLSTLSSISPGGSRRIYHRSARHRPESASSWSSISPNGTRRHRRRGDKGRKDSLSSFSSVSPGGSRRIYHRSARHRPESASSWSSISPHGTRRHRRRSDSPSTFSSVSPGGSRRIYHRSARHRPESASSWSSISPHGTRRHRRRSDSPSTFSSVSPGGSRRIYHRSARHRAESASSWSSISPHGTRRHRKRMDRQELESPSTWSSVSPGGSHRIYHRSTRHRRDSVSSWSSISVGGTRRHRRRGDNFNRNSMQSSTRDHQMGPIKLEQQIPAFAAPPSNGLESKPYDSSFNIQKQETSGVHASRPDSATSSNSSIPSLYGRIVIVGQSAGFKSRLQSYRRRSEGPKKPKGAKGTRGANGYESDSDSSISSIASDRLPPAVVKVRGGEYAIFEDAGETIFEDHPVRKEDTYANPNTSYYGSTR